MILFFDTETTGLAKFNLPIESDEQPRLVQLGMILTTDELEIVSECCLLVKCAKKIEQGAFAAHGKSDGYCKKYGSGIEEVINLFQEMASQANLFVGHNLKFDKVVMEHELFELYKDTSSTWSRLIKQEFCTMLQTTDIVRIPSARGGYKWPKLSEAYEFFTGKTLEGAHNALVDCHATLEIYRALKKNELKEKILDAVFTPLA